MRRFANKQTRVTEPQRGVPPSFRRYLRPHPRSKRTRLRLTGIILKLQRQLKLKDLLRGLLDMQTAHLKEEEEKAAATLP